VVERSRVAVKMMLFRARKKLRPALEELELHESAGRETATHDSAKRGNLPAAEQAAEKSPVAEESTVESKNG